MTIAKIKKEMLAYEDFYGGDLSDTEAIKDATTKKELADIINNHRDFMVDMLADAESHLRDFKKKIGLSIL